MAVARSSPQTLHPPFRVTFDDAVDPADDALFSATATTPPVFRPSPQSSSSSSSSSARGRAHAAAGSASAAAAAAAATPTQPSDMLGPVLGPLWSQLRHPTLEALTDAMDGLTPAPIRLNDDIKDLYRWMGRENAGADRGPAVTRRVRRLLLRVFGERPSVNPLSEDGSLFARGLAAKYTGLLCPTALVRMNARVAARRGSSASTSSSSSSSSSSSGASARQRSARSGTGDAPSETLLLAADFADADCSGLAKSKVKAAMDAAREDADAWAKGRHPVQSRARSSEFRSQAERQRRSAGGHETLGELSAWMAAYNALDLPQHLRLDVFGGGDVGGVWGAGLADEPVARDAPLPTPGAPSQRLSLPGASDAPASLQSPADGAWVRPFLVGFSSDVLTLSSIRRPRRVTGLGSDERPRQMLVKAGEDLRLDQRIEGVFELVNRAAASWGTGTWGPDDEPSIVGGGSGDAGGAGAGRRAAQQAIDVILPTYGVLPLTPRVGAIEWVPSTRPLRDVVLDGDARTSAHERAKSVHRTWLKRYKSDKPETAWYLDRYARAPEEEARAVFRAAVSTNGRGALLEAAQAAASSPQALLALRSRFASTLAAVSLSGWVLGIGDRHPDNFLIAQSDWSLVPIDFGYAFGFATSHLPVPELIPFRLSPALADVLSPLDPRALLSVKMAALLKALRRDPWQSVLGDTLDVFVREPTLDWRRPAATKAAEQATGRAVSESLSGVSSMTRVARGPGTRLHIHKGGAAAPGGEPSASDGEESDGTGSSVGVGGVPTMMEGLPARPAKGTPSAAAAARSRRSRSKASEAAAAAGQDEADGDETVVDMPAEQSPGTPAGVALEGIDFSNALAKVQTARRKLAIWHPATLIAKEVDKNPHVQRHKRCLLGIKQALHGDDAPPQGPCESVEDHVEALVSLATDPNIMIRQWQGLALYL